MRDGVRHAGWHSRVGPAAYPIATLQKDELRKARPGGGMHLSVARAAVTIRPLSSPPSSAKVGQIELGARLGKVCARTSCFGFLRGHKLTSEVRGHLARDSAKTRGARGSSGDPPPHSPRVRGRGPPHEKFLSQAPPSTQDCSCSHFHRGPAVFIW